VREGAIIPLGPVMQHAAEKAVDPLSVHVYGFAPDDTIAARTSEASLYEDDGLSNDYQLGKFQRTSLSYRQTHGTATLAIDTKSGDGAFRSQPRNYRMRFHGLSKPEHVRLDGKVIPQAGASRSRSAGGKDSKASWSADATTGEISVFIPRSVRRAFTVELTIPER
jgi:hypothetical protein